MYQSQQEYHNPANKCTHIVRRRMHLRSTMESEGTLTRALLHSSAPSACGGEAHQRQLSMEGAVQVDVWRDVQVEGFVMLRQRPAQSNCHDVKKNSN